VNPRVPPIGKKRSGEEKEFKKKKKGGSKVQGKKVREKVLIRTKLGEDLKKKGLAREGHSGVWTGSLF